jgi:uncharacterized membrane protein YdbT with pleckstrin-like domain
MSILLENEKVLAEVKRHPFYFYVRIMGLVIVSFIPWFLYSLIFNIILQIDSINTLSFFVFSYSLFLIFIWLIIFIFWTDYFVDSWIITDSRVIDFELKGLFHKDVASVRLENIQDVKVNVIGIVEHWLKIGDIHLQTAGANKEFVIRGVCQPDEMKAKIFEAIHNLKK